jgi:hypothetical protein
MVARAPRAAPAREDRERTDEELAEESESAEEIAVLEAEVWTEVVRRGLNVVVLPAVEEQALGRLVVLLRAAGLDVVAAREGPRVLIDSTTGRSRGSSQAIGAAGVARDRPERLLSETLDAAHRAIRGADAERGDPDGLTREYHRPAGRSGSRDPRRSASGFMASAAG